MRKSLLIVAVAVLCVVASCGDDDTVVVDPGGTASTTDPGAGVPPGEVPEGWEMADASVGRAEVEVAGVTAVVDVAGNLPTPCHVPVWEVARQGTTVAVTLASASDPDTVCAQVLEPYETTIPLGEFQPGTSYTVALNGETVGEFEVV